MTMNKYFGIHVFLGLILTLNISSVAIASTQDGQLAPPKAKTIDRFGVNLTTSQVTSSLATVAIGGENGLSHDISSHTNKFSVRGHSGYLDKYAGGASWVSLGQNIKLGDRSMERISVLRVFAMGSTADFITIHNGDYSGNHSLTANYHYEALGDTRNTLDISADRRHLYWTQVDGTVVTLLRARSPKSSSPAAFKQIVYPNGLTITVNDITSITSNTGYQLKYDYIDDHRPIAASKRGRDFGPTQSNVPPENPLQWSQHNPKFIRGINNAVEYCDPLRTSPCELSHRWPTATFNWPGGMPRAIFIDDSVFSVTDMEGGVTDFHFSAQKLSLKDPQNPHLGEIQDGPGVYWRNKYAPRLMAVKPAGSDDITLRYEYLNEISVMHVATHFYTYPWVTTEVGRIKKASSPLLGEFNYWEPQPISGPGPAPLRAYGSHVTVTSRQIYPTALSEVSVAGEGQFLFDANYRNFMRQHRNPNGADKFFVYDNRGNLTRVIATSEGFASYGNYLRHIERGGSADTIIQEAHYPEICTNRKTCNQPTWVKDGRGHTTHYTYHGESGAVASITHPANAQGLIAQTRYEYEQKQAYVKNAVGQRVPAGQPIWLKVAEKSCQNSQYNGACGSNDETIVAFEYEHDNLLMTARTVTADGQTLRICYAYDHYGNRIGETEPNANLTSCNN